MNSGTSKGNQSKYFVNDTFIKLDSLGWCESVSEVLVSELQKHIQNGYDFVDYSFCEYKGLNACCCKSFLREGEYCTSLYTLLKGYNLPLLDGGEYLKNTVIGLFNMLYGIDIEYYLSYIIYLDALTLNEDRHLKNIAFICKDGYVLRPTPIFDNGLALLADKKSYSGVESVSKVKSQPFCSSFDSQVKLFDNPDIKIDYKSLFEVLSNAYHHPELYVNENRYNDLKRGIVILLYQLKRTEGCLWKKI